MSGVLVGCPFGDIVTSALTLAEQHPERELLCFLSDGERRAVSLTCGELVHRAMHVAAALVTRHIAGERILIALPPGNDYAVSLLACFLAGAIAVPTVSPARAQDVKRIASVGRDCTPRLAIVSDNTDTAALPTVHGMEWCRFETIAAAETDRSLALRRPAGVDIAIIQYTSGSTDSPKGVCITHDNLSWNSWNISSVMDHRPYIAALWLPPYHDMGLIGLLHGLFTGCPLIFMSPFHFLQKPVRWLAAISRYGATLCTAPDFAYRLCAERIAEEDCTGLDLSTLDVAYCGAEPVRQSTLDQFTARFAPYGFRDSAFAPCYGLAEATLMVSSRRPRRPVAAMVCHAASRTTQDIGTPGPTPERTVMSCGEPAPNTDVAIIDPESGQRLADKETGEIHIRGLAVSPGYWKDERNAASGNGWRPTGDLGFLHDGEVYVTGRLKTTLIVRGRNIQAEDIECTAGESHPYASPSRCAAIGVDDGGGEQLYLVLEAASRTPQEACREMLEAARSAVANAFGILPARILVIRRGLLPRTTSGKLRRSACRTLFSQDGVPALAAWDARSPGVP